MPAATTFYVPLFKSVALPLADSGWVIDTPGVRSFGLAHITPDAVTAAFDDTDERLRPGMTAVIRIATETLHNVGRGNAIMAGQVKQFSNAELKELSKYVAAQEGELKTIPQAKFR